MQATAIKVPPESGWQETATEPKHQAEITGSFQQHIAGRYRRVTVTQLAMAWWLYREGYITRRQLRITFAAHEMAERRRYSGPEDTRQKPLYRFIELKALVGGRGSKSADRDLSADVKRLRDIGLVKIEPRAITFARSAADLTVPGPIGAFANFLAELPNQRRSIPVPRRTLRALAAGFSRAETAYMIAALIRSVYWHKETGLTRTDGRTKGSWIADVFGVSRRAVTAARGHLIQIGWLQPKDPPQWALNKWGVHDVVNVDWEPSKALDEQTAGAVENTDKQAGEAEVETGGSATPISPKSAGTASPYINSSSPSSKESLETRKLGFDTPGPPMLGSRTKNASSKPKLRPSLRDVVPSDLGSPEALLILYAQAIAAGLATNSTAGQLEFLAFTQRARTRGRRPGALLLWLLSNGKREFITQADEDAAARLLREDREGPDPRTKKRKKVSAQRVLTEDERLVEACLRVAAQQRINDPFLIAAQAKNWTRARWESAYLHYTHNQAKRWYQPQHTDVISSGG